MEPFSGEKIIRWLRAYRDWRAELGSTLGVGGTDCFGQSLDSSYTRTGGSTAQAALRLSDLREKVATVERWLHGLSPGERVAANYWLDDEEGSLPAVASALKIGIRRARWLTEIVGKCDHASATRRGFCFTVRM